MNRLLQIEGEYLMQKILLLEDDLNLNRGIALLLSREGYEVRQVYTIKEAKEAFQKGDYALVISDITLPDGTGLDFGRMVRAGGDTYLILSYGFGSGNRYCKWL